MIDITGTVANANPTRSKNLHQKGKDFEKVLKKEMTACESDSVRGKYLSTIYDYLS